MSASLSRYLLWTANAARLGQFASIQSFFRQASPEWRSQLVQTDKSPYGECLRCAESCRHVPLSRQQAWRDSLRASHKTRFPVFSHDVRVANIQEDATLTASRSPGG